MDNDIDKELDNYNRKSNNDKYVKNIKWNKYNKVLIKYNNNKYKKVIKYNNNKLNTYNKVIKHNNNINKDN